MSSNPPEKIHLIPDEYHIERVGKLADGRLVYQEFQLDPVSDAPRNFFVTYIFDADGNLVDDAVSEIGVADDMSDGSEAAVLAAHEKLVGPYTIDDIWVRPFSLSRFGLTFGLVASQPYGDPEDEDADMNEGDDGWRVEALPGNTLSFYAPWEEGLYDT